MAQQTKQKTVEHRSGLPKKSSRGNMDEYEAVRTIVAENPGLLMRVLDKIRSSRENKDQGSNGKKKSGGET